MPTAVVIDGAYFLRRFSHSFPDFSATDADDIALGVISMAAYHVATRLQARPEWTTATQNRFRPEETSELYRIFFYDCPPLRKRVHWPVSGRSLNLGQSDEATLRHAVHEKLQTVRKVALRRGRLNEEFSVWRPRPEAVRRWLDDPKNFDPLDEDFVISPIQKGVDMRLGLDVASMAFKKQVDQIILVAGDADFVPATKLARREGIDVVLDPMWGQAAHDLIEHVDGIRNCRLSGHPVRSPKTP